LNVKIKEVKAELLVIANLSNNKNLQKDERVRDEFEPFYAIASNQVKEIEENIEEFNTLYQSLVKLYGELPATPTYTFFDIWSKFLHSIDDGIETVKKIEKEKEQAEKAKNAPKEANPTNSATSAKNLFPVF
jgi:archaellum component FlaC